MIAWMRRHFDNNPLCLPLILVGSVALTGVVASSCSPSVVRRQAIAADTIARALNGSLPAVTESYRRAQLDAAQAACGNTTPCADPEAARDVVAAVRAKWSPVWLAWTVLRAAHDAWSDQLARCQVLDAGGDAGACEVSTAHLARTVLEHQTTLRCALVAVGVQDPIGGALVCAGGVRDE